MKPSVWQDSQTSFGTLRNQHDSLCSVILCSLRSGSITPYCSNSSHWRLSLNLSLSFHISSHCYSFILLPLISVYSWCLLPLSFCLPPSPRLLPMIVSAKFLFIAFKLIESGIPLASPCPV